MALAMGIMFIHTAGMNPKAKTLDPDEIRHFAKDAPRWWDESGPFAPLHRLNPARLGYIKTVICDHYGRDRKGLKALTGLRVLDVGCGGGLVTEPMARLGATVMGVDGDAVAIGVAETHARQGRLDISYATTTTDVLVRDHAARFDVVLALEIVEHVKDVDAFLKDCVKLCKPGGVMIVSTLNKTIKSFAMGKIAAEYILRWVPAGTHDWNKFIKPSVLARGLRDAGATPVETKGLVFNPLENDFAISNTDIDVNYFMVATKDRLS